MLNRSETSTIEILALSPCVCASVCMCLWIYFTLYTLTYRPTYVMKKSSNNTLCFRDQVCQTSVLTSAPFFRQRAEEESSDDDKKERVIKGDMTSSAAIKV